MSRTKSWSVKGIDADTRETARNAAQIAGLPIGSWIDAAILKASRGELPGIAVATGTGTTADTTYEAPPAEAPPAYDRPAPPPPAGATPAMPPLRPSGRPGETAPDNVPEENVPAETFPGESAPAPQAASEPPPAAEPGLSEDVLRAIENGETPQPSAGLVADPDARPGAGHDDAAEPPSGELPPHPLYRTEQRRRPSTIRYAAAAVVLLGILAGGVWIFTELSSPSRITPDQVARETPPAAEPAAPAEPPPGITPGSPALGTEGLPENVRLGMEMAKAGDAKAQHDLGMLYLTGRYVAKDPQEAATWFERAAVQGLVNAQFNLGVLYQTGEGVPQNPQLAVFWFQSAAEQGDPRAQHNLATAYAEGRGVARNYDRAIEWFTKAANEGLAQSQYSLGQIYEKGTDTILADMQAARAWYAKAAAQGDQRSAARLEELKATAAPVAAPAAPEPAPAAAAGPPLGRAEVREIQQLLRRMNFDPGPADGQMGARTADAIRLYQQFAGLEVNGEASMELLEDLRAVAATLSGG